ncbi:hypothetical protein F383_33662 [Gossypium arboreum]|uniref:Uncharacterized protein n=1 Tax=Gossypium arboreum TaxID=29729 RepID=A0A0B0MX55_GOSAR|nr:hypothetical protein F383_33662 [Gossypium arboreum]
MATGHANVLGHVKTEHTYWLATHGQRHTCVYRSCSTLT